MSVFYMTKYALHRIGIEMVAPYCRKMAPVAIISQRRSSLKMDPVNAVPVKSSSHSCRNSLSDACEKAQRLLCLTTGAIP